ncbi:MAG: insulinase family protein, partial [Treponema sp.]|nr:insulinase family protein [Treponema sp.]
MRKFCGFLGLLALVGLLAGCTSVPYSGNGAFGGLGKGTDTVPLMEKVRTGVLPSGLRYYLLENSKPENRAYLTLAVKAGSVLETDDEQGLAHFVEHMAFNGTARFPEAELIDYLRSLGMRFGPEVNAYTSFDNTVYGIEVPVETNPDGIRVIPDTALAVIDDWTHAISFNPSDVDDERSVIMEEYRSRLGANDRIMRQMLPVLFGSSPYANRLPIGLPEIVEGAPASRLVGFYQKWYRADNMAVIITGDFDSAALEASLAQHFSTPTPDTPTMRPQYDLPEPQKGKTDIQILTDPELTSTRVDMYFIRSRGIPRDDLAYYREEIIDILIDRMLSLRVTEDAAKADTPYISAGAGTVRYGTSSRFYVMSARAKTGMAERSLEELLRQKESLLRYGFTKTELQTAAKSLISDMEQLVSEKDTQESSGLGASLVDFYLNGGNYADPEWELNAIQCLLPRIGAPDINAAIRDYFRWNDIKVFISAPEADQASLPSQDRVRQLISESKKLRITPPGEKKTGDSFLDQAPQPGNIISESVDTETGAVLWELGNGAHVILQKTANRNNEIIVQAMARGGYTSVTPEDKVSASLAPEMITASGLGPYSRTELNRKLADKQVSFSFSGSAYNRGLQGSSTTGDLRNLFEMMYIGFTEPRIDPQAVQVMMDKLRTNLAQRNENPEMFFSDEITRVIYGGNSYFMPLAPGDLDNVNIDTALSFIRRGLNPGDYTFIFTGNLDMDLMRQYVETYIASIPQKESWNNWNKIDFKRPTAGAVKKSENSVYKGK